MPMGDKYAVICMRGNHTFILHQTHQEAIQDMKRYPDRYDTVEMVSVGGENIHLKMHEPLRTYLRRCAAAINKAEQNAASDYVI